MTTAVEVANGAKAISPRAAATPQLAAPTATGRAAAARSGRLWLARAAWAIGRTGRPGLVGIALLLAATLFVVSTHLEVAGEVEALRRELDGARARTTATAAERAAAPPGAGGSVRPLPARGDVPAILRELFSKAVQAHLAIDSGRYELRAAATSGRVVRTQVVFPVTGPYPQIRAFLDATLATMPSVAVSELGLSRRSIGGGNVEARIGLTVYTAAAGDPGATPGQPEARLAAARVVAPVHAAALFAQHSWFVPRPAPPPPPEPPPPEPTAPPLPYAFVGTYAPGGEAPVYFLARGDRVIDAHVGDTLDGVYRFESAAGGTLTFVYLPLDTRQTLAGGAPK